MNSQLLPGIALLTAIVTDFLSVDTVGAQTMPEPSVTAVADAIRERWPPTDLH